MQLLEEIWEQEKMLKEREEGLIGQLRKSNITKQHNKNTGTYYQSIQTQETDLENGTSCLYQIATVTIIEQAIEIITHLLLVFIEMKKSFDCASHKNSGNH